MNISRRFRRGISALMAATVFCVTTMGNITPADPIIVARSSASNAAKASRANARKASASEALPLDEDGLLMDGELVNDLEIQVETGMDRPVLSASLVDEFGNSIDDRYNQIPVKVDGELLPLDDPDTPPVKDVYVKTGFFGLKKRSYHFVEATADGSIITAVRLQEKDGEDEEQSASAAETQTVATGSNAQKRAAKTRQKSWFYTENGLDWTEITEDTELLFVYAPENRTVFEYEDEDVVVTAVTEKEDALPAGAELVVKPVTRQSTDYHYDAYLAALNQAAEENRDSDDYLNRYEENNTLLYDIAFLVRSEDGAEAADAGAAESFVEYQPEEGAVKVSFTFKKNQLKNDLGAKAPEQVKVHHIPLKDNTDDAAVRTDSAANVQAEDLAPETLKASFREVSGQEQMEFTTESFSVYAFAYTVDFFYNLNGNTYRYTLPGGGEVLLSELVEKLGIRGDANQEGRREGHTAFENTASFMNEISDVRFSNGSLVQVTRKGADWSLKSLAPFNTEEALTITMKNGDVLKVKVTDDQEVPYVLKLYGYNFGGLYKSYYLRNITIGYPDDVKPYLTFESFSTLSQVPFTYATKGFDVEKIRLIQEEENTDAGYRYRVIGFVPVVESVITSMTSADDYNNAFVFSSVEEAKSFITVNTGVLYGEKASAEMLDALQEKGALAVVWQRKDPVRFKSLSVSITNPSSKKIELGNGKTITLKLGFSGLQKGDYTEDPVKVTVSLDDGLIYSEDYKPEIYSTDVLTIDQNSIAVSKDRKEFHYSITEIKKDTGSYSYSYLEFPVKLDVTDVNQAEARITVSAVNGRKQKIDDTAKIVINRPYFEVRLWGPQDAWIDMNNGTGTGTTVRVLKFAGADDYHALAMHKWSFDEEPIKGICSQDLDGSVMVGRVVNNQNTNTQWTLVGFVPIERSPNRIRESLYGVYYLNNLDACKQLIQEKNGVLYGETPTEDQARSLAQYKDRWPGIVCVWYIQEAPTEIYKKYSYDEREEYVPAVHPAAYTKTSEGIGVDITTGSSDSESGAHPYNVTFTIPENYDQETITLNTEINEALKQILSGFQPGDRVEYNIRVVDKSGRYRYLKDSGAVGTIDYYNLEGMNYSVIGSGFEGYQIENSDEKPGGHSAKSRITRRGYNFAIQKLQDISAIDLNQPTDEKVGKALYTVGYGAEREGEEKKPLAEYCLEDGKPDYAAITKSLLDDYYLDFLNAFYYAKEEHKDEDSTNPHYFLNASNNANDEHKDEDNTDPHYKSFTDLSVNDYRSIFNSDNGTQVMETNPVLAAAMYYGMYEQSILMSEVPTGIDTYKGTYYWMHDWNEETEGNKYEEVIYNQYGENKEEQKDGSIEHKLRWYQWIIGSRNGNNMQDTYFGLAYQFKLVRTPITVQKHWISSDGTDITDSEDISKPEAIHYLLFRKNIKQQEDGKDTAENTTEESAGAIAEKTSGEGEQTAFRPVNELGKPVKSLENLAACVQTLTKDSVENGHSWTHTFTELPGRAEDYCVLECSADGTKVLKDKAVAAGVSLLDGQSWIEVSESEYWSSFEKENEEYGNGALFTLNNPLKAVEVKKIWDDHGETGVTHPDVTITLLAANADETAKAEDGQQEQTAEETGTTEKSASSKKVGEQVIKAGSESVKWENLPYFDYETGSRLIYSADESKVPGYRMLETVEKQSSENPRLTIFEITNKQNQKSFTVEKFWMQHSESISSTIKNASATVQLCVSTNPDHSEAKPIDGKTVTLPIEGSEKPWTYTWEDLDVYDDYGNELVYTVEEESAILNGIVINLNAEDRKPVIKEIDGVVHIENPLPATSLTVEKHWMKDGEDVTGTLENATATLRLVIKGQDSAEDISVEDIELPLKNSETPWTYTWEGLKQFDDSGKKLEYAVEEISASLDGKALDISETNSPVISTLNNGTIRIENPMPKEPEQKPKTSVTVEKRWLRDGKNITLDVKNATATLQLLKKGMSGAEDTLVGEIVLPVKGSETPWTYTWKDLPQYDDADRELTYQVVETAATYDGKDLELNPDYGKNGTTVLVSNVIPTPPTPEEPPVPAEPDRPYTPHHSGGGNPPKVTKQNRPKPEGSVLGVTREPEPVLPVPQVLGVGRLPRTGENSEAKSFDRVLAAGSTALILLLLCGAWALGKKRREE